MHNLSKNIENNSTFNTPNLVVSEYFLERETHRQCKARVYNKNQLVKQTTLTNISSLFVKKNPDRKLHKAIFYRDFFVFTPPRFQTKESKFVFAECSADMNENFFTNLTCVRSLN